MSSIVKLVLTACVALATLPSAAWSDIGGIWSSTFRTKGGLGSQWTFTDDGRATYTFGVVVDFFIHHNRYTNRYELRAAERRARR